MNTHNNIQIVTKKNNKVTKTRQKKKQPFTVIILR